MELLGVADVAALIDEPEHVVSVACIRFATFIPMVRIGRDRWYPPEAIDVLRVIFDQIRVGVPDEHIETVLTKRFPVTRIASEDLTPRRPDVPTAATHTQAERVRDVFDRYQSTIQNEMLQMRREIAQFAPPTEPPPTPRAQPSLSELARQESGDYYSEVHPDPRKYGFTHQDDVGMSVPPIPRPEMTERRAAPDSFTNAVEDDTRTLIAAVARQAAASESAALRQDVDGLRQDVSTLVDQFRTFSQHLGMASAPPRDMRERRPHAANGTEGGPLPPAAPQPATRLEVVPQERDRDTTYGSGGKDIGPYQQQAEGNGLLGHLSRRAPRRMGKSLLGEDI